MGSGEGTRSELGGVQMRGQCWFAGQAFELGLWAEGAELETKLARWTGQNKSMGATSNGGIGVPRRLRPEIRGLIVLMCLRRGGIGAGVRELGVRCCK